MLLGGMIIVKGIPKLFEAPDLPVLMLGFMGPAAMSLLIMLWWLFASRAGGKEKLIGTAAVIAIGIATTAIMHVSMQGMSPIMYQIPTGIALFAIALVVKSGQPASRLKTALIACTVGFGAWGLVQMEGVTGKFDPKFSWRWSPTAEQEYLRSLADRSPSADNASASGAAETTEVITRADSPWAEFRGPNRDSKLTKTVVNEDWSQSPPKLIWKTRIGPGWSSFSVAGHRLFTQEQRGESEVVVCLSTETGDVLWTHETPGRFWEAVAGAGPRATPTLGDKGLFALGANGNLVCLDPSTGSVRWQRELQTDAGCKPPQWGFSASPLIYKSLVIVHAGGPGDKGVLAYDSATGEPRWNVASGNHSYSSAQLATFDGIEGLLMLTNAGLQFLSAEDGTTFWNHEWAVENYRATQPLILGDSILFGTSLGLGTRRLTVSHAADAWSVKEDWTSADMKPDFNDFVEYQGNVYGFDGNIFACIDATTGKRLWKRGRYGNGQVLLLSETGQLLIVSETGDLLLVKADPAKHIELGKIAAINGKTWNHPVLVGNRLYLRNGEEVACYELALAPESLL